MVRKYLSLTSEISLSAYKYSIFCVQVARKCKKMLKKNAFLVEDVAFLHKKRYLCEVE